jgi:hypothetical protein
MIEMIAIASLSKLLEFFAIRLKPRLKKCLICDQRAVLLAY